MTALTLSWALERLGESKKVGIASVVSTAGSVPGKVGARLAIAGDEVHGTVGGAGLEMKVIARLRELVAESEVVHERAVEEPRQPLGEADAPPARVRDEALRRDDLAAEQPQQRRLAERGPARDGEDLARLDLEADRRDRGHVLGRVAVREV